MVPAVYVQSGTRKEDDSLAPQVLFVGYVCRVVHSILPKQSFCLPWQGLLCFELLVHEKAGQLVFLRQDLRSEKFRHL